MPLQREKLAHRLLFLSHLQDTNLQIPPCTKLWMRNTYSLQPASFPEWLWGPIALNYKRMCCISYSYFHHFFCRPILHLISIYWRETQIKFVRTWTIAVHKSMQWNIFGRVALVSSQCWPCRLFSRYKFYLSKYHFLEMDLSMLLFTIFQWMS